MRNHKTILVDEDVWIELRKIYPSISELIRDYLRNLRDYSKSSAAYDRAKLEKQLQDLTQKNAKNNAEIEAINNKLIAAKEVEEREAAKQESIRQDAATKLITCAVCGIPKTDEKLRDFGSSKVCRSCFLTADHSTLRKFMRPKDDQKN